MIRKRERHGWRRFAFAIAIVWVFGGCSSGVGGSTGLLRADSEAADPPRLVLQITVDQLRGDLPTRFLDRLGEGGFRYLLDEGTHYANAHYRHANTETAVGHATLFTGADPAQHGIVANDWIDPATGAFVYNTEDARHHLIGQEPKAHAGMSPLNLLASTIGDELVNHSGGRSRVFSVSVKDRGAILAGGHAGKAFWYSKRSGRFVTSTYYYDAYPEWVDEWNAKGLADDLRGSEWRLLRERSTYLAGEFDDRPFEAALPPMGRTFPHPIGDDPYTPLRISLTPLGDELTLDFVKALVEAEQVGRGDATDFLAISFSSTDYVGHLFGPSSLESEDNLLRLDRVLSDLFAFVDAEVGLEKTLIVLSADHGAPEAPEHMAALGLTTGRFAFDRFRTEGPLTEALEREFGRADLIETHSHPYLYLDRGALAEADVDPAEVERFLAAELLETPGLSMAATRSEILEGRLGDGPVEAQIGRNFHPARSGDIHLVQDPYWFLHSTAEADQMGLPGLAAIHGSPWTYDTFVPIFFAGHRVPHGRVDRSVGPHDIAATIAAYLRVKPPSGSAGRPLEEVLERVGR